MVAIDRTKFVITNCTSSYAADGKKPSFSFLVEEKREVDGFTL